MPSYEIRFVDNLPKVFDAATGIQVDGYVVSIEFPKDTISTPTGDFSYINGPAKGIVSVGGVAYGGVPVVTG